MQTHTWDNEHTMTLLWIKPELYRLCNKQQAMLHTCTQAHVSQNKSTIAAANKVYKWDKKRSNNVTETGDNFLQALTSRREEAGYQVWYLRGCTRYATAKYIAFTEWDDNTTVADTVQKFFTSRVPRLPVCPNKIWGRQEYYSNPSTSP